ncbi:Uncharacterised protein [uncultured archaeon]|nr:Uncharacterised protein [uncultured archaeon]
MNRKVADIVLEKLLEAKAKILQDRPPEFFFRSPDGKAWQVLCNSIDVLKRIKKEDNAANV